MKTILITGATGLVGSVLGLRLAQEGYKLKVVTRDEKKARQNLTFPAQIIVCDLNKNHLSEEAFADVECVIHLAGETVDGKWTPEKKKAILESRTLTTQNLLKNRPQSVHTVITASAQGVYGHQGDRELDENGTPGYGFLAEVCQAWEKPFHELCELKSARVVILRLGLVIAHQGGAIRKMLPIFQKNLGATLGSGDQWMSWIHIEDLCQVITNAITNINYRGVINAVSDSPVQNSEFTKKMCHHLKVMQAPRVPEFALRLLFGEMSEILTASAKVVPKKLKGNDFKFKFDTLDSALRQEFENLKQGQGYFTAQQYIPFPIEKVFNFFADAQNLEKLTPDLLRFKIKNMSTQHIQQGSLIDYTLKIRGVPANWQTKIETWNPPFEFVDTQLKGPYSLWHHTHKFETLGEGTLMSDYVRYKLPMGFLGRLTAGSFVQNDIETIFAYRRQIIAEHTF